MWNVHRMSLKIEHRNLEIRKTLDDFFVQVWNFLLTLSLNVLGHKEREAQSFYSGFFICPQHVWHREQAKANRLLPKQVSTLLTDFFKISQKSSARFRCVASFALASLRFPSRAIVTSLSDTFALRTHKWTPVLMLHLTNPCAEPKGSQPN